MVPICESFKIDLNGLSKIRLLALERKSIVVDLMAGSISDFNPGHLRLVSR